MPTCKRCEEKPTDLPKKATLPSVQTDTMSYTEEYNTAARYHHLKIMLLIFDYYQRIHHKFPQSQQEQQLSS